MSGWRGNRVSGWAALAPVLAFVLLLAGCGGGGGGAPAGSSPVVIADPAAGGGALDEAKLMAGTPEAPVLQQGPPMAAMAAPMCPPAQGASGNNTINAYYKPDNAFDGDMNTWWVGAVGAGAWDLYYGFPDVRVMDSLNITFYGATYVPSSVVLKVSTDGCNWTDLGAMSAGVKPAINVKRSVRYLWVEMAGNPATNYPLIRDIDWVEPQDNLYASGGPGANEAYYFPSNAFDGDMNTWWAGQVGAGSWDIYYMFDSPRMISMVSAVLFNINYRPTSMKLYVSDDGQYWMEVGEMEPGATPHQFVNWTTQYIRIQMTGNPPSNFPLIKDISFDMLPGASSGDSINSYYKPDNAFDGNMNTWWTGAQNQYAWDLFYEYATSTATAWLDTITINYYSASHAPSATALYTSLDGVNWTKQGDFPAGATPSLTRGFSVKYIWLRMSGVPSIGYPLIKDVTLTRGNTGLGAWVEMGAGSATDPGLAGFNTSVFSFSTALDSAGRPVVAWHDTIENGIYVMRWDGAAWVAVGAGATTGKGIATGDLQSLPDIAIDANDNIYCVWITRDYSWSVYVLHFKYFDGSQWKELGIGSAAGDGLIGGNYANYAGANVPGVAVDAAGRPVVAWSGFINGQSEIFAKKWDGAAWVEVNPGSAQGGGISNTADYSWLREIETDAAGNIYVYWYDGPDNSRAAYARQWDGAAWSEIGPGSATGLGIAGVRGVMPIDLAMGAAGPLVTWDANLNGTYQAYMAQWDGAAWAEVGAGSMTGSGVTGSATDASGGYFGIDSQGGLYLAYSRLQNVYVQKWNGAAWNSVGGALAYSYSSNSGGAQVLIGPDDNPIVIWLDNSRLFAKRWDPNAVLP
jgi:hypothetical protein